MKDYYKTLGVEKNASKDDIKKAFHKMAHQYHPDKNKNDPTASQKFKEASEAYSILSDDTKRKQFDMFGASGVGSGPSTGSGQGGFGGFDPNASGFGGFDFSGFQQGANGQGFEFDLGDVFGDLFGRSSGSRQAGRSRQSRQARGSDISVDIQISFEESIFGVERDLSLNKASKCSTCQGSGAALGTTFDKCMTCDGKGQVNETRRSFIGVFNTSRICDVCHGHGQVPKVKCSTCRGIGVVERLQEISVKIPAGIEDGQMVRLTGMGEAIPGGTSGDLYVRIHVKAHPYIRKNDLNLETELKLKLSQAILGAQINIKTLDGDLLVKIPEGSNTGDVLRVKGKGVPSERGRRGDFMITLTVDMPKKLSKEAKNIIDQLGKQGL